MYHDRHLTKWEVENPKYRWIKKIVTQRLVEFSGSFKTLLKELHKKEMSVKK